MILTIVGLIYICACAGCLFIYRRALRRASVHPMILIHSQRNNVIPFRRKTPGSDQHPPNIESVTRLR
jgi:hypothetical protein